MLQQYGQPQAPWADESLAGKNDRTASPDGVSELVSKLCVNEVAEALGENWWMAMMTRYAIRPAATAETMNGITVLRTNDLIF